MISFKVTQKRQCYSCPENW